MTGTEHAHTARSTAATDKFPYASRQTLWVAVIAILCLTILAYAPLISAGFIWDDDAYVLNNYHIRSLSGLASIWSEPESTPQYYPMVFSVFWLQYHVWGLNPLGYHLVNILLHCINALLLWACLRRLHIPAAFWIAALFSLHPVHVESVGWITELKNVLSLFFYLLSLHAYLGFAGVEGDAPRRGRAFLYPLALLAFLLALFSKTVSGSLPAAILLIRWWQAGRIKGREVLQLLPFFALAMLLGRQTARLEVEHVLARGPEWDFSFVDRLLIAGRAVWFYAAKLLWPYPLSFNYPRWIIDRSDWPGYLFPLALSLLLLVLWTLRKRIGRGPLAAVLFFVGSLFPALGFFNVYPMRFSFVADHFQYMASIGILILICGCIEIVPQKVPNLLQMKTPVLVVVCAFLATLTWQRGSVYRNNLTLFTDTIEKNPASWFSYANRATYYANEERVDLAMADLRKALEIKPDEPDALHTRGVLLLKQQDFTAAFADIDRSIALRPWRTDYYRNRAVALRFAGQLDKALLDADHLVAKEPWSTENYLLRASIHAQRQNYTAALADLNRAADLDPEESDIWANRGLIYYRQGETSQALASLNRALALRPDSAPSLFNRGLVYVAMRRLDQATADFQQAKQLGYSLSDSEMQLLLTGKQRK